MARRYTIDSVQLAKHHTRCTLNRKAEGRQAGGGREGTKEDGRGQVEGGGGREQGEEVRKR